MALRPRYVAAGMAGLAYVIASQWLMTRTPPSRWSAVALLTPMLAVGALGAWRNGQRLWSVVAGAAAAALALQAARGGGLAPEQLYLAEHVAIHVFLAITFGITLRRGARPLIARLADRVHDGLTPAMERYTRKVTAAWTIYFAAMAALSLALYVTAPFAIWATFANLVTPLALALMFGGEYLLRYRLHPEFERVTLQQMIHAYAQARNAAPPRGPDR
ncbi:MAG: hypothetical protein ABI809_07800 [Caldimonas sp.]